MKMHLIVTGFNKDDTRTEFLINSKKYTYAIGYFDFKTELCTIKRLAPKALNVEAVESIIDTLYIHDWAVFSSDCDIRFYKLKRELKKIKNSKKCSSGSCT